MTSQRLEEVGYRVVLAGAAQYIRDSQGVNSATAQMGRQLEQTAVGTRVATAGVSGSFTAVSTAAGGLAGSLTTLTGPFQQIIGQGRDVAQALVEAATSGGGLSAVLIGLAAAGAAAVTMFVGLGTAGAQWAVESQRIQTITGLSQQQAELYGTALELVGGDSQTLVRTSFLLERQLSATAEAMKTGAQPATQLTRAMDVLGVSWRDANGDVKDMGQLLPEVLTRLGEMDDKTQAGSLSMQIFGRFGQEITNVVKNWDTVMPAAAAATDKFSTANINAVDIALEYQKVMVDLRQAFQLLAANTLPAFIAISQMVVTAITDWVSANGKDFVDGLSAALIAGARAVALFAEGFSAVLGPAMEFAGNAVSLLATALGNIPREAIEMLIRFAGTTAGYAALGVAIVAVATATTILGSAMLELSLVLLTTPAGWIALAVALAVAGAGYLALKGSIDANAAALRDETEGRKLASEFTIDELRTKAALLSAQREENVELLNNTKAMKGANPERERLTKTIADQDARLRALAVAIGLDTEELRLLDEQQKKVTGSGGGVKTTFELMGFAAGTTVDDLKKLSSEMIVTTILAENLKRLGGSATPFEIVNSDAFKEQIKIVLGAYQSARVEAAAAAEANTYLVNQAGYLTAAQEAAAKAAQRAAEQANAEAQRAAEEYARAVEKMVKDAADAAKRIRDAQVQQLDQLGALLTSALRARYAEQLRVTLSGYSQQQEYIEGIYEERVDAANAASRAEIAAIDASTAAVIAGINAQIAALRGAGAAEDREGIVRQIALAYDPNERAEAERSLRDFDRNVQINALQAQAQTVQEQARVRKQQIEDELKAKLDAIEADREATKKSFEFAEKAAKAAYEAQTDEFTLQSLARKLLMDKEQAGYVQDMISKYAPQWATAGISFGEQLLTGIRSQIEPYLRSLQNLIPGGSGQVSVTNSNNAAYTAALNQQGKTAAAGGAPKVALDTMRDNVVQQGGTPEFHTGLAMGVVPRPMMALLDTGEVVLTAEQQKGLMGGPRFERGAFEGMFNGAHFNGSPEQNAKAFRIEFEAMMNQQLGRDAYLNGV